jgi:ABC-type nitrate/sulfonate/bicarbonate transport system substrate-binding protein
VCLTSVNHYADARHRFGDLAARFITVVSRRHPIAGLVRADSPCSTPADLAGRRLGAARDSGLTRELLAGLALLRMEPPELVEIPYAAAPAALGRGDVDVIADFAELAPPTSRQAGVDVRAIPVGAPVYASGVVAADRLDDDVVVRLRAALADVLEEQRREPSTGLAQLVERYPDVSPQDALESWRLAAQSIYTDAPLTQMTGAGWDRTLEHVARVHGQPPLMTETVRREAHSPLVPAAPRGDS